MPSRPAAIASDRAIGRTLAILVLLHGLWLLFRWGGARVTDVASDLFQVVVLGGAAAWAWRSTRHAGESRLAWSLLAAGMTTWALATAYWSYSEIFKGILLPVPSAADVGWLLYTALATAAFLVAALRRRSPAQVAVAALDTVLTAVGMFLVVWILLLEDVWATATGSPVVLAVTLAYPLGDVAVVTAALGYAFRLQPEDRRRVWALPVGATVVALGNLNLSWSYLHAGFQSGSVSDVLWTGGLALVGYGVHCATRTRLRAVPSFATPFEQGLPYLAGAAALGIVVWHFTQIGGLEAFDQQILLVWISLFLARQFLFLRHAVDVQRRLEQAQALAGLGSWELVGHRIRLSPMADALLAGQPSPTAGRTASHAAACATVEPGDRAPLEADLRDLARSGKPFDRTVRLPLAAGGVKHLRFVGVVGPPAQGTVQDVTRDVKEQERRQREAKALAEVARLKEVNELKTNFINMAAHELNTPLTPIKFALANLKREAKEPTAADDEARREGYSILERNVDRLAALLRDILDAARIQSSKLKVKPRRVDLGLVVRDVVEELGPTFRAAGVEVVAQPTPVEVMADPGRVHGVLLNLASNAAKFTPAGGKVTVQASAAGGMGRIKVIDTGVGLLEAEVPRLFQPFSQVGDRTVKTHQGTGLGLYLSRGFVEAMGGRIWAESAGPGKGSTFAFELPLAEEVPARAAQAA